MMMIDIEDIKLFSFIKLVQIVILWLVPIKFDTSSVISLGFGLTDNRWFTRLFQNMISWDNVYFNKLFKEDPTFEHEFVFSPGFTYFIRLLPGPAPGKFVLAMILTNLAHLSTCVVLKKLTYKLFTPGLSAKSKVSQAQAASQGATQAKANAMANYVSKMCILSVAGVFLTVPYSESICAFCTISSYYLRECSLTYTNTNNTNYKITNFTRYFISGFLIAIAYNIRTNAILFGIIYLYDTMHFLTRFQFTNTIKSLITGFCIFIAFAQSIGSTYSEFCPYRGEWCFDRIPSLLMYSQSTYWNNGFLNYWTLSNLPNFLFMLPNFIILLLGVIRYWSNSKIRPIVIVTVVYLILNFFFWHVQIMNRISSFIPLNYWYLAEKVSKNDRYIRYYIRYLVIWIILQTGLFAAFLPPA